MAELRVHLAADQLGLKKHQMEDTSDRREAVIGFDESRPRNAF